MEFINPKININFIGQFKIAVGISILFVAMFLTFMLIHGLNYGIDFAGGTEAQIKFVDPTSASEIRASLKLMEGDQPTVQRFGSPEENEYIIRVRSEEGEIERTSAQVEQSLKEGFGTEGFEIRRIDAVGPKVGAQLRRQGLLAVVYALIGILVYIAWRFNIRYAPGAIIALIHDVIITLGIFTLLGKEVDLPIIAAMLTIIGYSLNDTIVLYDRIRENRRRVRRDPLPQIINRSVNETLSRTILTSLTTLLVVLAMFILGGGIIHNFALALVLGILVGTYSSIYIASPLLLAIEKIWAGK